MSDRAHSDFRERMNRELKRGGNAVLILHVLASTDRPIYGFQIISLLKQVSNNSIDLGPGTVYPLMKRLEKHRFVESKWAPPQGKPNSVPHKYYTLTPPGRQIYTQLLSDWRELMQTFQTSLDEIPKFLEEGKE